MECNYADYSKYENNELLKGIANVLHSDVSEIENTLKTVDSSINDQLKSALLVFNQQYNELRDK